MTRATVQLIEIVERLNRTGHIGDGTIEQMQELAHIARREIGAKLPPASESYLRLAQARDRLRAATNAPDRATDGGKLRIRQAEARLAADRSLAVDAIAERLRVPARGCHRTHCPHCGPLGATEEHDPSCPRYPMVFRPTNPDGGVREVETSAPAVRGPFCRFCGAVEEHDESCPRF